MSEPSRPPADPGTAPEQLYELALAAPDRYRTAELSRALAEHYAQESADWAVRLAADLAAVRDPESWRRLVRQIAWQLSRRTSLVTLRPLFETHSPVALDDPATEVRACLLYELALRSGFHHPRHHAAYLAYGAGLRDLGHPLAWLPLTSYRFEQVMWLSSRTEHGAVGSDGPERLRAGYPEIPPTAGGARAGRAAHRIADPARTTAAAGGFGQLAQQEAVFYALPEPLDPADFNGALLAELDAECLEATTGDTVTTVHTTADDLAGDLFLADFGGGCYGEPQYGAYARLHAWQSLYAVLDLGPETPHAEAIRRAADFRFLRFALPQHSDNRWFTWDFTDTAFACLDPDRTRVTVLAASETD
ncbi:DUF6183 family protein [Streptomyces sp. NPDC127190]|uniref:DUF6183 family protein n=1 Tax=unclassified Streptomyces TaxID=2593676 RepID=UPI003642DCA0